MGIERERRFLVVDDAWREGARGERIRQGYLTTTPVPTVRVRVRQGRAWLTVKGATVGAARSEFEYPIPLADAEEMLRTLCADRIVDKTRYVVDAGGHTWEVDEFAGGNAGLVLAEIELDSDAGLEHAVSVRPAWIGAEVTADGRLANASLAMKPLASWSEAERNALLARR